jgi:DNA primase
MVHRRNNEWQRNTEVYTPAQIEAIADYCGLDIESETTTHFLAFCPFHNNTDTPAFALDKEKGLWTCFNPSCDAKGNMYTLLRDLRGVTSFEAARVIKRFDQQTHGTISARLSAIRTKEPEFIKFPEDPLNRMAADFWNTPRAENYMKGRGFHNGTLAHFGVGYSSKRDMIIVPMHDPKGMPIGFIGRSIEGKRFENSRYLPKSKTAWNYHRAKLHGDTVIVVESAFDAMRVHQAGYPNVVALLGSGVSEHFLAQLNKTFSKVIIMTDFEPEFWYPANCSRCKNLPKCKGHRPGRDFGWKIANGLVNKKVLWAAWSEDVVYPHNAKDAGDMTDEEIRECVRNAMSHFKYTREGLDDKIVVAV